MTGAKETDAIFFGHDPDGMNDSGQVPKKGQDDMDPEVLARPHLKKAPPPGRTTKFTRPPPRSSSGTRFR